MLIHIHTIICFPLNTKYCCRVITDVVQMQQKPAITGYVIVLVLASTIFGCLNSISTAVIRLRFVAAKGQSKVQLDLYRNSKSLAHIRYYNHPFFQA